MIKMRSWQGKGTVNEIHDGDTFKALIDLGFRISFTTPVRIRGIQSPELPSAPGIAAADFLRTLIAPGDVVTINSRRLDLHGRAEADVTLDDGRDLAAVMLAAGHAVKADQSGHPI
jgi:endonuclease YncB( thermonuclease family)